MKAKQTGVVKVNEAYCKGCGICIHFCPAKVLSFKNFKAHVANPQDCIGCMSCELRCPDFAITVEQVSTDKGA